MKVVHLCATDSCMCISFLSLFHRGPTCTEKLLSLIHACDFCFQPHMMHVCRFCSVLCYQVSEGKAAYGSYTWCIMYRGSGICVLLASVMLTVKYCGEKMDCTRWSQAIRVVQGQQMSNLLWSTQCSAEMTVLREYLIRWKFPSRNKVQFFSPPSRNIFCLSR